MIGSFNALSHLDVVSKESFGHAVGPVSHRAGDKARLGKHAYKKRGPHTSSAITK